MEFTVTIDSDIIDALGVDTVSEFLQDAATRLRVKASAQEALAEMDYVDELVNDPTWQTARQQAWEQEKHRYTNQKD